MIRNIYILLLLSLSFGTVYGATFYNDGTYTIDNATPSTEDVISWKYYDSDGNLDQSGNIDIAVAGLFFFLLNTVVYDGTFIFSINSQCCGEITDFEYSNFDMSNPSPGTGGNYNAIINFNYTPEYILGDINGDGYLDVLDIVIAVDLILNGNYDVAADVNEDGQLNVLDVVMLVNWVLNGGTAFDPDCLSVFLTTTSADSGNGLVHHDSIIPVTQNLAIYGKCTYDFDSSSYTSGYPIIYIDQTGDGDGNGNTTHNLDQNNVQRTAVFNLKSDTVKTKEISWSRYGLTWHGETVDNSSDNVDVTFGQYHVWGATRIVGDNGGAGLAPDSTDMDTNFNAGRKDLLTTDFTDFGDYKQITNLDVTRIFFAIEVGQGTLSQFQGDTVSDFSNAGDIWTNFLSTTVSWKNTGDGTGTAKTFNVYFSNLIGAGTYYYRVR